MWVLQIEFTKLPAVCFARNTRKWQRWWHGAAITGPLSLLVLHLPCHPRASTEEKQSAKGRSQGHWGYKRPSLFGAAGIFSFSPKAGTSRRCRQKLGSPSAYQHGVRSPLLHPALCLAGYWGLPRGRSGASTPGLDGPCSLRSWHKNNGWVILLSWILYNITIFLIWLFLFTQILLSAS